MFVHIYLYCMILNYILQGMTQNMASPALAGLIIDFFTLDHRPWETFSQKYSLGRSQW